MIRQAFRIFLLGVTLWAPLGLMAQTKVYEEKSAQVYESAMELYAKGKYSAARERFDRYAESGANELLRVNSRYYGAMSAMYLGNSDGEARVRDFVERHPESPLSAKAFYELANHHYSTGKFKSAVLYFEKVNGSSLDRETRADYTFKKAYSYFNLRMFQKALPLFNSIKGIESERKGAASYYAGYIEYEAGDYDKAVKDLKVAGADDAYKNVVPYLIANIYYKQGDDKSLLTYAKPIVDGKGKVGNRSELTLLVAEAYFRAKDYGEAGKYYGKYLKVRKKAPADIYYRAGYSAYRSGASEDAISSFKKAALAKDSLAYYASYYLGSLYLKTDNKNYALTAFDKARKADFNEDIASESDFNYGKLNYDLERFDQAIRSLNNFVKKYPSHKYVTEANELISDAYLNGNNYENAIKHLEGLPYKSPKVRETLQIITFKRGVELFNQDAVEKAIPVFEKSLQYPYDKDIVVKTNYWIAEAHSLRKAFAESIPFYTTSLRMAEDRDNVRLNAMYGLGYAYFNTKQYSLALPYFKNYVTELESRPNKLFYGDALMRLADCYYVDKTYQSALNYYDLAVSQNNPDVDYAYFQKGMIEGVRGNFQTSRAHLAKVVSMEPRSKLREDAIYQMAAFDNESGDYHQSIEDINTLIKSSPHSPVLPLAIELRARNYYNLKKYREAADDYERIIEEFPKASVANDALLGLQGALKFLEKQDELDKYIAMYKKANPESEDLQLVEFETARNLYFSQKYTQGITRLTAYLIDYPESAYKVDAKYFLAECYYRDKQDDNARKWFDDVVADGNNMYVNRSLKKIIDIETLRSNHREAVNSASLLSSLARTKRDQYDAWSALMKSYYSLAKFDSTRFFANQVLEKANVSTNATNSANLYLGKAAYGKKEYNEAIDQFLNTLNTAKDVNGAEAQYLLGKIFHEQGKYEQSTETLIDLNKNFGVYEYWLSKAFLLIADNYIAQDELFQAKATLESIIEGSPVESVVEEAKDRLAQTEKKTREQIQKRDTTQVLMVDSLDAPAEVETNESDSVDVGSEEGSEDEKQQF
ncbi:hypothetical protein FUAX_22470 [Fulvitalea axinellae]|uniref:Tetratricopeptide repeat protein n=1 Tax=Fulvitalea axinellae TaxID=1182444 RepID=A0AAU9CKJ0_9BACT|nr:hypothetical protein FUAX_22470 [Fulvitalea axinellae]